MPVPVTVEIMARNDTLGSSRRAFSRLAGNQLGKRIEDRWRSEAANDSWQTDRRRIGRPLTFAEKTAVPRRVSRQMHDRSPPQNGSTWPSANGTSIAVREKDRLEAVRLQNPAGAPTAGSARARRTALYRSATASLPLDSTWQLTRRLWIG